MPAQALMKKRVKPKNPLRLHPQTMPLKSRRKQPQHPRAPTLVGGCTSIKIRTQPISTPFVSSISSFTLFTNQSTAWAQNEKDDASIIKFMKLGNMMTVQGTSSRGTNTKDTYSLKGFIAAYKAMNKKCK